MGQAVFTEAGEGRFVASELARGPWDAGAQHGGAPAALLMREFERLPAADGLQMARVTYELLRPVPLGELDVRVEVMRPGRRAQLMEGSLTAPDGTVLMRARALQVQRATGALPAREPDRPPSQPKDGEHTPPPFEPPYRPLFAPDAIEVRLTSGGSRSGAATAWFRLRAQVVEGEEPSPLQSLAAAADFGNGISSLLSWDEFLFINPDLTVYLEREPAGEWICLDARTTIAAGGIGAAESILYDERGRVGRAAQALLVAPR